MLVLLDLVVVNIKAVPSRNLNRSHQTGKEIPFRDALHCRKLIPSLTVWLYSKHQHKRLPGQLLLYEEHGLFQQGRCFSLGSAKGYFVRDRKLSLYSGYRTDEFDLRRCSERKVL